MEQRSMGIGPMGNPHIVIVRKFRWTFGSDLLPEHFLKSIKVNLSKKRITFASYEVIEDDGDINILRWLDSDHTNERMIFTTYDGCGTALYRYEFYGIKVLKDFVEFDCASSEESTRKVLIEFSEYERHMFVNGTCQVAKPRHRYHWRAELGGQKLPVSLDRRPSLDIEESEINFLNAKTWLVGKGNWQPIVVSMPKTSAEVFSRELFDGQVVPEVKFSFCDVNDHCLETWIIHNVFLLSTQFNRDTAEIHSFTLRYNEVYYNVEEQDVKEPTKKESIRARAKSRTTPAK